MNQLTIIPGSPEMEFINNLRKIPTLEKDQLTDVMELFLAYLAIKEKLKTR